MKHLLSLKAYNIEEIYEIFKIAEALEQGEYKHFLEGKTIILFFPNSSIRTRVTFEKGIELLGGKSILFPQEALTKREEIQDVVGYLNNWVDAAVVRIRDIEILEQMAQYAQFPIINAMTDCNHPCEILSDLYALSKLRKDITKERYLFVGGKGNIGCAWKEASEVMGFSLVQSCPKGYEIDGIEVIYDLNDAIKGKDIICTDPLGREQLEDFKDYQVTLDVMRQANPHALLNPCPPFYREEEVSKEVIESPYFVGYTFKKCLLEIQQAIMIYSMMND